MKNILTAIAVCISLSLHAQQIVPVVQTGHSGEIRCINWDNTGRYLASADANNDVVINDVISGKQFYKIKVPGKAGISELKFDGNKLLINNMGQFYAFDMNSLTLQSGAQSFANMSDDGGYKIKNTTVRKGARSLINKDVYVHFTQVAVSNDNSLVIAGDERGWLYFCNPTLKVRIRERMHLLDITDIDFSDDGKFVAIASADRSISIWSLPEIKFEKRLIPRSFNVNAMDSHPDGKRIAFGDELGYAYLLVFEDDKITCEGINTHKSRINDVSFTPNKMCVATAGGDNRAAIVDFEQKMPLQYFNLHPNTSKLSQTFNIKAIQARATKSDDGELFFDENVYSVAVSPDGKQIAYSGGKWGNSNPVMKVSSISNLNLEKTVEKRKKRKADAGLMKKNNTFRFYELYFTSEKEFWGMGESNDVAQGFKLSLTGYDETTTATVRSGLSGHAFYPNCLLMVAHNAKSMSAPYLIKKDMNTSDVFTCTGFEISKSGMGKTVRYEGHRGYINDIQIIREKNYLISAAEDASMIIWNLETGEKIMTVYVVDQGKLVFVSPDNYYMAQGDALTGMGFNYNGRVLPAEQFDLKYNRPDLVMEKLGIFKPDIIALYHKAYLKRLSKSGFTEAMLKGEMNLPELEITNIKELNYKSTSDQLNLNIAMSDRLHELDRLNVWVNDVPLYGTQGMSLRNKNAKDVSTDVSIPLSEGQNIIQISCLNSIGVESLKEEFEVFFEIPEKRKPDLYLVSIAVAEYSNAKYNLRYTVNDGKGFVNLFNKRKNSYNSMYVDSFFNNSCTRENVLMAKERLMKSHVDDYVIIHIAGHGLLDDNLDFYFATSDIDFKNPAERGLNYEELEGLLDGIPARNKLFLMDACHSGEVDKDDEFVVENVIGDNQRGVTMFETRGETMPKTGLHNSFELMRIMFADLRKGTGAVVISAAAGGGYALENEDIENGIFTYSLIQAFKKNQADVNKDGFVSVSELRNFIFDEVRRLSNGRQQPTSRRENLTNDFVIW